MDSIRGLMKPEQLIQREKEIRQRRAGNEVVQEGTSSLEVTAWTHDDSIEALSLHKLGLIQDQIEILQDIILSRLERILKSRLDEDGLNALCSTLKIDAERLAGKNLDERIGALITMMQHNGRLDDLITAINPQQKGSGHTGGYAGVVQARIPFPGDRA